MFNPKQQQAIQEQINDLPREYQVVLASVDWSGEILGIGQRAGLNFQQLERFVTETTLVLIGLEGPEDYLNNLVRHIGLGQDQAQKLQQEVGQEIFLKMERMLQQHLSEPREERYYTDDSEDSGGEDYVEPDMHETLSEAGIDVSDAVPKPDAAYDAVFAESDGGVAGSNDIPAPVSYDGSDPYHEPLE